VFNKHTAAGGIKKQLSFQMSVTTVAGYCLLPNGCRG